MAKKPSFQFYPSDWIIDPSVATLDYYDMGVYMKLLCFASQTGGYLRLHDGGEPLSVSDLAISLGLEKNKCANILTTLVRHGCLKQDEEGCFYNSRMVKDSLNAMEYYQAKIKAGKAGNDKRWSCRKSIANASQCDNNENEGNIENIANESQTSRKRIAKASQNNDSAIILGENVANESQTHRKSVAEGVASESQTHRSSSSSSLINTLSHPREEKEGSVIAPPPGMPKTETEAIERAERVGVPEWFVREKAYPQLLAMGYRDNGNLIRNYEYWVKLYYGNWDNKNRQKTGRQGRKTTCTQPTNEPGLPTL